MQIQNVSIPYRNPDFALVHGEIIDLKATESVLKEKAEMLADEHHDKKRLSRWDARREARRMMTDFPMRFRPVDKEAEEVWKEIQKNLPEAYRGQAAAAMKAHIDE